MNPYEFAKQMELDGEEFYLAQAASYSGTPVEKVCLILAAEEALHGHIVADLMERHVGALPDSQVLAQAKNIFETEGEPSVSGKDRETQLDFYRKAQERERESIALYEKMASETESGEEKKVFHYLAGEEGKHFAALDLLTDLLRHAEEWVESAEFGLRGPY